MKRQVARRPNSFLSLQETSPSPRSNTSSGNFKSSPRKPYRFASSWTMPWHERRHKARRANNGRRRTVQLIAQAQFRLGGITQLEP
jgi:hypothetical protein